MESAHWKDNKFEAKIRWKREELPEERVGLAFSKNVVQYSRNYLL